MKLTVLNTGRFKLDGGAMFGVVPKRMWSKMHPADENNLCTWSMRCLLIEEGNQIILIDTGIGDKQDDKFRQHFFPHDCYNFDDLLYPLGLNTGDITDVIITHFHFDHVGGAVRRDESDRLIPTFENARYWSNQKHYDWANQPNPREAASFLKENFNPLLEHGVLHFLDTVNGIDFNDFIKLSFVYGHTEAMMIPYITTPSGNVIVYGADLLPSHHHIGLPYVMSYDVRPLETMKEKESLLSTCAAGQYFVFYEHDNDLALSSIHKNELGRFTFGETADLQELI